MSYAAAFANASGLSPIGPYSEPVLVRPASGATVMQLPEDPLKMATKIYLYRRITTSQGNDLPQRQVAIIEPGTSRWQDTSA